MTDERATTPIEPAKRSVPSVAACVAAALATALVGLCLAVALRGPLRHPADRAAFQARLDAWNKLDQELTPEQRTTGPKRPKN
jgi:hypothetical protein